MAIHGLCRHCLECLPTPKMLSPRVKIYILLLINFIFITNVLKFLKLLSRHIIIILLSVFHSGQN